MLFDKHTVIYYNTLITSPITMNTCTGQLQRIRVTLDFEVFEDFDVNNINFHKVFQIDGNENLTVSIENRSEKVENLWDTVYDTMI